MKTGRMDTHKRTLYSFNQIREPLMKEGGEFSRLKNCHFAQGANSTGDISTSAGDTLFWRRKMTPGSNSIANRRGYFDKECNTYE